MLSKSDIQSFLQCPRKLWLERHRQDLLRNGDPSALRRAFDGNIVGEKARQQLGDGFIWPTSHPDWATTASEAKQALAAAPGVAAAEVPMLHDDVYARADALIPDRQGYVLRETKASTFPLKKDKVTPAAPEDHHLNDLAIQAWVMSESGIDLTKAELNLLNSRWRYPGGGDYSDLFRQLDVTSEIRDRKEQVQGWKDQAERAVNGTMPDAVTGKQCANPYPCPFNEHCQTLDPPGAEFPIELLPDLAGKNLAKKLKAENGYTSILDPKPDELTGKHAQLYQRMQEAYRLRQAVILPETAGRMAEFPYPRYFFDFEGIDLPVPRWAGVRPYQQIPFQWSCHVERSAGVFEHFEFLDVSGGNPSQGCIEAMLNVIDPDDGGAIFVYHATYEKGRIQDLAERHQEWAEPLGKYLARIVDLLPLVKDHYYHPDMMGSFSIKKVLPTIAPDLNYEELDEVQEGTGAALAYIEAALNPDTSPERRNIIERNLFAYCKQDTWAMVEIAHFLAGTGRPTRPQGI